MTLRNLLINPISSHAPRWMALALWGILLVIHLPVVGGHWLAVFGAQNTEFRPVSFLLLNLCVVVFTLKMVGAPGLRLATDGRALITMGLALVLLHVNAAAASRALPALPHSQSVVAGVVVAAGLVQVSRQDAEPTPRKRTPSRDLAAWWGYAQDTVNITTGIDRLHIPRAPPATSNRTT